MMQIMAQFKKNVSPKHQPQKLAEKNRKTKKTSKSWGASHAKQEHNVAVDENVKLATKHLIKLYKSYIIHVYKN